MGSTQAYLEGVVREGRWAGRGWGWGVRGNGDEGWVRGCSMQAYQVKLGARRCASSHQVSGKMLKQLAPICTQTNFLPPSVCLAFEASLIQYRTPHPPPPPAPTNRHTHIPTEPAHPAFFTPT